MAWVPSPREARGWGYSVLKTGRAGRGPRGEVRAVPSGVLVWLFFFPRKKFALATPRGGRLLRPPPPPLRAHLSVQIAKRLRWSELQILQQPDSPTLQKQRLVSPGSLGCRKGQERERERERDRRFPALITSPPRLHGLPGPFRVARFCAEDCTSPSLLGSAAFRILEACKLGSPAPGQNLQRNLWSASLGPAGRRSLLHEPVSLRAGARRWRGP